MAEELAELFAELAAHRLVGLQARFGVVTSVTATTAMVQLDSDSASTGPWPVIRGMPSVGDKVMLFAVPGTRGYVAVGRSFVTCPDPTTKCTDWHWPHDTVIGTYTLTAVGDRVTFTVPVTGYRQTLVELVNTSGMDVFTEVRVRVYCPEGWTGDPDDSAPAVVDTTQFLIGPPFAADFYVRAAWDPSGIDGDWTIVVDAVTLPVPASFIAHTFGAECCAAPSSEVVSGHVDIPTDPAGTTFPSGYQNDRTKTQAWLYFDVVVPEGVTSIDIAPVWDDPGSLAGYTAGASQPITTGGYQARLFGPGRFYGHQFANWHWDESTADAIPGIPFLYGRGTGDDSAAGYYFRPYGGALLYREDFVAGTYVALFGTDSWNLPQPPFTVGVTLEVTLHSCNAANDNGGWGPI